MILAGCSGYNYRWASAFRADTFIDFTKKEDGFAMDKYFQLFFDAWLKKGMTVSQAMDDAYTRIKLDKNIDDRFKHQCFCPVRNDAQINGNRDLRFADLKVSQLGIGNLGSEQLASLKRFGDALRSGM